MALDIGRSADDLSGDQFRVEVPWTRAHSASSDLSVPSVSRCCKIGIALGQ
jgi:hypothetical protein